MHSHDFTAIGSKREVDWLEEAMKEQYEPAVAGSLVPGLDDDDKEGMVLNRAIRWTSTGVEHEAGPQQV